MSETSTDPCAGQTESGRVHICRDGEGVGEALKASLADVSPNSNGNGYHGPIDVGGGARATPLEQALELHRLGYWAIALYPPGVTMPKGGIATGKEPIGGKWGLVRWDPTRIRSAFRYQPGAGVGIGLGPGRAPDGRWEVDFEIDGPEGEESYLKLVGYEVITTPSWPARRGAHRLLGTDRGPQFLDLLTAAGAKEGTTPETKGSYHLAELPGLEIRTGGYKKTKDGEVCKQTQSAAPPTCTNGFTRAWSVGPAEPVADIPEAAFDFLEELIHRKGMQLDQADPFPLLPANLSPMAQVAIDCETWEMEVKKSRFRPKTQLEAQVAYAQNALKIATATVAAAGPGSRHNVLLKESLPIAGFVNSNPPVLTREEFLAAFYAADQANGHTAADGQGDAQQVLESALAMAEPRDLSQVGLKVLETDQDEEDEQEDEQVEPDNRAPEHVDTVEEQTASPTQFGRADNATLAKLNCTDLGNAERLVRRHGVNLRFCHPWNKWLVWDGKRWRIDNTAAVKRKAKNTVRRILAEAATIKEKDDRKALRKWGESSESKKLIDSMIGLASSEEGIPVLPEDLNKNPWLLNCPNGTVNLQTGKLQPHDRADLITVLCPVEFKKDALCPTWEACLKVIFDKNEELIKFWQRLCGLMLTGIVTEQILPICWGSGANGKTTVLKTLIDMLGADYAITAAPGLLVIKNGTSHPTDRADLYGKRLAVDMESAEDARLNETLVKQLTGSDRIRARKMREDFWEFEPTHKLIMCTNHKPAVKETKHAIWRRINLIPFTVKIEGAKEDKGMLAKLRAEHAGILAWCVKGCLDWQKDGLKVPKVVSDATKAYQDSENVLREFIADRCLVGANYKAKSSVLYQAFKAFLEGTGEGSISQRRFGEAMTEEGYVRLPSNGIWYLGLDLRTVTIPTTTSQSNNGTTT